jgi:hypothetical protein
MVTAIGKSRAFAPMRRAKAQARGALLFALTGNPMVA